MSSRITRLSADREIFEQNQEYYNSALERAGYSDKIEYMGVDEVDRGNNVDRGRSDGRKRISRMKGVKHLLNEFLTDFLTSVRLCQQYKTDSYQTTPLQEDYMKFQLRCKFS